MRIRCCVFILGIVCFISKCNAELLARWEFDSTANSTPGNYVGTLLDDASIISSGAKIGSGILKLDGGIGSGEVNDGEFGIPAEFDGVIKSTGDSLDPNEGDYTFTAWVKPSSLSGRQHIVDKRFALNVFLLDGRLGAYIKGDGASGGLNLLSNKWVTVDTWMHLALVIERNADGTGKLVLYADGIKDCEANIPLDFGSISDTEFNIGVQYNRGAPQRGFNGYIDDVGVWNEALDFHQIRFAMNSGVSALARGQVLLLQKGIQFISHSVPSQFPNGLDMNIWRQANFTTACIHRDLTGGTVNHYDNMTNYGLPSGGNAVPFKALVMDTSHSVCSSAYLDKLVAVQLRDEDPIDAPALPGLALEISQLKELYPSALIYTDQSPVNAKDSQGNPQAMTVDLLKNYIQACKPDMLSYFEYPFRWDDTNHYDYEGGSPTQMYKNMGVFRAAALSGIDGNGTRPIPYGMFVQTFADVGASSSNDRLPSESEYNLQLYAGLAFGFKSFESFIYTWNNTSAYQTLFFTDNLSELLAPDFTNYARILKKVRNTSQYMVRLISTDVRMVMGKHYNGNALVNNPLPSGVPEWNTNANAFISSITVENGGTINGGAEGDVVIGFFKIIDPVFAETGHEDDTYFMVVNGLSDSEGSKYDCRQRITLNFDFGSSGITKIKSVSPSGSVFSYNTYRPLFSQTRSFTFELNGGEGRLFKFDQGGTFFMKQGQYPMSFVY